MVLKKRDAAFTTSYHFTITLKSTRFISFDICNHWIRKYAHNSINESFFKIKIDRPLFEFFEGTRMCWKYLFLRKKRNSAASKQCLVNTVTFHKHTAIKIWTVQIEAASLFYRIMHFLWNFDCIFYVKIDWQSTQQIKTHPVGCWNLLGHGWVWKIVESYDFLEKVKTCVWLRFGVEDFFQNDVTRVFE